MKTSTRSRVSLEMCFFSLVVETISKDLHDICCRGQEEETLDLKNHDIAASLSKMK